MPSLLKRFRKKSDNGSGKGRRISGIFRTTVSEKSTHFTPLEQSLTWTMSEDSAVLSSPVNSSIVSKKDAQLLEKEEIRRESREYTFTEEELMQHELNHIRALTKLQSDINTLKKATEDLVKKHEKEIDKKDEEYLDLLVIVGQKDEELATVRSALAETKMELERASCKLIQTQHTLFENTNKSWRSYFN